MTLTLYGHPLSSDCQKVLIALYEHEVPFKWKLLSHAPENGVEDYVEVALGEPGASAADGNGGYGLLMITEARAAGSLHATGSIRPLCRRVEARSIDRGTAR